MNETRIEIPLVVEDQCRSRSRSSGPLSCTSCSRRLGERHGRECSHVLKMYWEQVLPTVDLRPITRDSDKCQTIVEIFSDKYERYRHTWIRAGQCSHLCSGPRRDSWEYRLDSYLTRGATDFEHDSAYAFRIPLIAVEWQDVFYHVMSFTGFIPPDVEADDLRVPGPGYDPMEGAVFCDSCKDDPHPIVEQYLPGPNEKAAKLLRGKRLQITIGPVYDEEEKHGCE